MEMFANFIVNFTLLYCIEFTGEMSTHRSTTTITQSIYSRYSTVASSDRFERYVT
jgi:hypothetical protein